MNDEIGRYETYHEDAPKAPMLIDNLEDIDVSDLEGSDADETDWNLDLDFGII